MTDDEQDFEKLAEQIDSPKISALSLCVAAGMDIPNPTQDLAKALSTTSLYSPSLKLLADGELSKMMGIHSLQGLSTTLAALDELEALTTYPELAAMASMPTATMQPLLNTLAAFNDLPDEVFSTAITASAVSARARTTSPTPSPPSTEPPADPSYHDIDAEASDSLYVNNALAIGSIIASQIEGLGKEQIENAAIVIGVAIVTGAALEYPTVRHALVSSSSAIALGLFMRDRRKTD